jgi:hypothetical protein
MICNRRTHRLDEEDAEVSLALAKTSSNWVGFKHLSRQKTIGFRHNMEEIRL